MTPISEITGLWLGLCRKPPAVPILQGTGTPMDPVFEGEPGSGAGGSGAIHRGIGAALAGMRTLNQNRQLLWFALLAGFVLAGSAVGQAILPFADWPLRPYVTGWLILNFLLTFAALFVFVYLLAGLVLSIPLEKGGSVSFYQGLRGAKKYIKPLFLWSLILTCAGLLLFVAYQYFPAALWRELGVIDLFEPNSLIRLLSQFPFNFTLDPRIFQDLPTGFLDGRSLVILLFDSGFTNAVVASAIALFLLILTPFVVPLVVLGHKSLRDAVTGSFALLKKMWAEVALCAVFLIGLGLAAFIMYLPVQAAHGVGFAFNSTAWVSLGLLYDFALSCFVLVVVTVGGIALRDLYLMAKSTEVPGSREL